MNKVKVYDLPTRLFHWLFAIFFISAFFIAKTYDDDSSLYPYHMMIGLSLVFIVLLRVIWGVFGSQYARFSSFSLHPVKLFGYFKDMLSSNTQRHLGHNPASSWAALLMMGLALGLGFTGYMMTRGRENHFYEEIHELMANAFIIVVVIHVAGVILHSLRHRDGLATSMMDGQKAELANSPGIQKSYAVAGVMFLLLVGLFIGTLQANYNPTKRHLNLFGASFQLGESEEEEYEGRHDTKKNQKSYDQKSDDDSSDDD